MSEAVRFRMDPKEDLSARADFTHDLMGELSREASKIADESQELAAYRNRAQIDVSARGSLRKVDLSVNIRPLQGVTLSDREMEEIRTAVGRSLNETLKTRMSDVLQTAITKARGRM